jgi:hypothetical protein
LCELAAWKSEQHLRDHFRRHHRLLRVDTIDQYETSAHQVVETGTYFEYRDLESGEWHEGYYDRLTRRLTAVMNDVIQTHYRCSESYVEGLLESTYAP